MLIKAYGTFWNPDIVDWGSKGAGNKGELLGWVTKGGCRYLIDFWDAQGIYVLLSEFRAIYVGKSGNSMGMRLRNHLTDRFAGRWDMFSWFSVSGVRTTSFDVSKPGQRQVGPNVMIDTLEALGILIADPSLNRKRESLEGAFEAVQPDNALPKTIRSYLEDLLEKVKSIDAKT